MKYTETRLKGAFVIELEKREDERGFFARVFDKKELKKIGVDFDVVEASISLSKKKGTMRGMHWQKDPYWEAKIIRCTRGKIFDVIVDLRPESETFKQWFGIEIDAENRKMVYVPKGFAHGFVTLEDNTEIHYQMDQVYSPESATGFKWDDKEFAIEWPIKPTIVSKNDNSWEPFSV